MNKTERLKACVDKNQAVFLGGEGVLKQISLFSLSTTDSGGTDQAIF